MWFNNRWIQGLSGLGGSGKSHCVSLIQRDMSYFLSQVLNADPDQPVVLVTAPTGSAAFQIGGTTIHCAFCCMKDQEESRVGRSRL